LIQSIIVFARCKDSSFFANEGLLRKKNYFFHYFYVKWQIIDKNYAFFCHYLTRFLVMLQENVTFVARNIYKEQIA